jgi:hypothetical protein
MGQVESYSAPVLLGKLMVDAGVPIRLMTTPTTGFESLGASIDRISKIKHCRRGRSHTIENRSEE